MTKSVSGSEVISGRMFFFLDGFRRAGLVGDIFERLAVEGGFPEGGGSDYGMRGEEGR